VQISGFSRRHFLLLRFALRLDGGQQSGVLFLHGLQLPGHPCGPFSGLCGGLGGVVALGLRLGQALGGTVGLCGGLLSLIAVGLLDGFGLGLHLHQLGACGLDLGGGLLACLGVLGAQTVGVGVRPVQLDAKVGRPVLNFGNAGVCLVSPAHGMDQLLANVGQLLRLLCCC
jgi:hypothetical protein